MFPFDQNKTTENNFSAQHNWEENTKSSKLNLSEI